MMEPYIIFFIIFGFAIILSGIPLCVSKHPRLPKYDYGKPYPLGYYRYIGMNIIFIGLSIIISFLVLHFTNIVIFVIVLLLTIVLSFVIARKLFYKEKYEKRWIYRWRRYK